MNELNEAFGWLRAAVWLGLGLLTLWAVVWVIR